MDVLKVLLPIVVLHAVVLLVVVVVIKKLLLSDTLQAVKRIRQAEAEVRKREEDIRQQIENHEQEFMRMKAVAEEELQQRRQASEKEVSRLRDQIIDEARREAARLLEQGRKDEARLRQQVLQEMEEKAVDYGLRMTEMVLSERAGARFNEELVNELIDGLAAVDADSITVEGEGARFVTSHPLAEAQRQRLAQVLKEKFGVRVAVQEKVDASLLGGLVLKLGSLEVDGSLRSRLHEAAAEAKKVMPAA